MPLQQDWNSETLAARCAEDGEFKLAARFWTGGLRLEIGEHLAAMTVTSGAPAGGDPGRDSAGVITVSAPLEIWEPLLAARPPRFFNDISNLVWSGLSITGDPVLTAQYYPAVARAVELLRPADPGVSPAPAAARPNGAFDAPVGRYIHLNVENQDYRIYFEEAGSGIPLLLQHTAGCDSSQYRHLFECKAITDNFRLIAYDLPFHGKSVPPTGPQWWASEYRLTGRFLRSMAASLSTALGLERPAFMGCSIGGLLALDLAFHHPEAFRAVISIGGALKIPFDISTMSAMWHPQVSNEYKARVMDALMSPTSPIALRKETSQAYAAGWPPAFLGDAYYYMVDFDLREQASRIDTSKVGVHILSGEYDAGGTLELGQEAHEAIPGSTWTGMMGVGHFPMSENPEVFIPHLLPVLEQIRGA